MTPSHILISRSSRSSQAAHATLSSPTETHTAVAGIFPRTSTSPSWALDDGPESRDAEESDSFDEQQTEPIDIDTTFSKDAAWPGTVKINVEATTFWCVKLYEVLIGQAHAILERKGA